MKYYAFISYSRRDEKTAVWLHRELESYRLPRELIGKASSAGVVPKRLFPIFRDRDELAGSADLGASLRMALDQSSALIVLCSPHSAKSRWVAEEITSFQQSNRSDRIFCVIVSGVPSVSRKNPDDDRECFARCLLKPEVGSNSGQECHPLAVDLRPGGDGRTNAKLKLIAGILGIDFNALKRRELQRVRARNIRRVLVAGALLMASVAAYLALADLGIRVPGRDNIQLLLDQREASVFRRVPNNSTIRESASKLRETLVLALSKVRDEKGRFTQRSNSGGRWDIGSHHQAMVAVQRSPENSAKNLLMGLDQLRAGFITPVDSTEPNIDRWWLNPPKSEQPWDGIGQCWHIISSAMFTDDRDRCSRECRQQIEIDLKTLVDSLKPYRGTSDGEWNIYPNQLSDQGHNAYSGVMALHAMLEMRRAGLRWTNSEEDSERILKATVAELLKLYRNDDTKPGWHGTGQDEDEMLDGLTLQITAILLRVAYETEVQLPESWLDATTELLIRCNDRDWNFPASSGEFEADILWHGEPRHLTEAIRFLWYPWALEAIHWWLLLDEKMPHASEQRLRVRRAQAHLVVDIGPKVVEAVSRDWTFVVAETLYGLASIPQ